MNETEPDLLARLWAEHLRAPFPPQLRGRDIEGADFVLLDADIAGCVSAALDGSLDARRRAILLRCRAAVEKVLPALDDENGAVAYYARLRHMAELAGGPATPAVTPWNAEGAEPPPGAFDRPTGPLTPY
ncbi:hypothetical protein Q5762_19645 [Streptomyces sp. P9(2023)]|uniref:hypothetical protein n=1 Tax=Streptomyces sp. P9(2023) TaxID=3064394 RepID=UPI0028F45E98|nr:hypothetical protein [Streptomyces sp. P9(2023)]MDT9690514.1 hypothetical protein [Streptomyces sp. P9(2023)]